jgi:hypothetical protein
VPPPKLPPEAERAGRRLRAWYGALPHFWQALVAAAALTASAFVLGLALAWGFALPEEGLAYAQVVTGYLALCLGAGLGFYAIREFIDSQARPRLELAFRPEPESPDLYSLVAQNTGNHPARWFMFQIALPFLAPGLDDVRGHGSPIYPVVATQRHGTDWAHWLWRTARAPTASVTSPSPPTARASSFPASISCSPRSLSPPNGSGRRRLRRCPVGRTCAPTRSPTSAWRRPSQARSSS